MTTAFDQNPEAVTTPSPGRRVLAALLLGFVAGVGSWAATKTAGFGQQDFKAYWLAGRAVVDGANPYIVVRRSFSYGFVYPLPTALAVVPLTWLDPTVAGGVFVGISSAILAFFATKKAWWPLLVFVNASAVESIVMGHWSILMTAAIYSSALTWVGVFKPNIGISLFVRRPSWRTVLAVTAIVLLSLIPRPTWPQELVSAVARSAGHPVLWRIPGGALLLAAIWRWRRPEARFLVAFALVPSSPIPYEALPLLALAETRVETICLGLCSDAAFLWIDRTADTHNATQYFAVTPPTMLWLLYIPVLVMILRRPNIGSAPAWIERLVLRLPSWLRGSTTDANIQPAG